MLKPWLHFATYPNFNISIHTHTHTPHTYIYTYSLQKGNPPPFINNPLPLLVTNTFFKFCYPPNFMASQPFSNCMQIHYFNLYKIMLLSDKGYWRLRWLLGLSKLVQIRMLASTDSFLQRFLWKFKKRCESSFQATFL